MLPEQTSRSAKRSTFQMRINPETKQQAERIYRHYGLTLDRRHQCFPPAEHQRERPALPALPGERSLSEVQGHAAIDSRD